jgi:hypothetical protein
MRFMGKNFISGFKCKPFRITTIKINRSTRGIFSFVRYCQVFAGVNPFPKAGFYAPETAKKNLTFALILIIFEGFLLLIFYKLKKLHQ